MLNRGEVTWSEMYETAECITNNYVQCLFHEVVISKYYMSDSVRKKNWEAVHNVNASQFNNVPVCMLWIMVTLPIPNIYNAPN